MEHCLRIILCKGRQQSMYTKRYIYKAGVQLKLGVKERNTCGKDVGFINRVGKLVCI